MLAILKKEFISYFSSPGGILALGIFLLLNGLVLWVFKGPFNIFETGFADLSVFFLLAPYIFLFLIPALCMKSFSEERKLGTLEILLMKPIGANKLVLGKFLAVLLLSILAILPTLIYVWSLHSLSIEGSTPDLGLIIGSYFGMILLVGSYIAIGLFASTFSENQIVAFFLSLILALFLFAGFDAISGLFSDGGLAISLEQLGMQAHYTRMGRGIIDTRDVVYFLSITLIFLYLTVLKLKKRG